MFNRINRWFTGLFLNKNIFYLWLGQVISQAGDSVYEIGLLWLMLELTGSKSATGLVAMSGYLPTLLFGMFSGALADRFDRRRIMLLADAARGILVLIIPLLYFLNGLSGLLLGIFTFILAMFNAVFNPARDAIVVNLVENDKLLQANSLIQTSWQFSLLLGPALAGLIIPLVGIVHLFNVDALTFFLSFWLISKIAYAKLSQQKTKTKLYGHVQQSFSDVLEGLNYARRDKRIWGLLMITAVDNLFIMGPAIVGAPIFVKDVLHESADKYALTQVAYAFGMILGTIAINFVGKRFRNSHLLLWGIIFDGLTFFPLLWVQTFWGMFFTLLIHSLVIPMIIIPRPTLVQKIVPVEMQGRVFSMISVGVFGFTAISMALTGVASDIIPINLVYAIIAVLAAASGAAGWAIKDFRNAP
ncbi:MAG: MFS transporter [Calditrichia bacterium]